MARCSGARPPPRRLHCPGAEELARIRPCRDGRPPRRPVDRLDDRTTAHAPWDHLDDHGTAPTTMGPPRRPWDRPDDHGTKRAPIADCAPFIGVIENASVEHALQRSGPRDGDQRTQRPPNDCTVESDVLSNTVGRAPDHWILRVGSPSRSGGLGPRPPVPSRRESIARRGVGAPAVWPLVAVEPWGASRRGIASAALRAETASLVQHFARSSPLRRLTDRSFNTSRE